jgi:hypothetical protein
MSKMFVNVTECQQDVGLSKMKNLLIKEHLRPIIRYAFSGKVIGLNCQRFIEVWGAFVEID